LLVPAHPVLAVVAEEGVVEEVVVISVLCS
jgi:hypothetical protein